MCGVERDNGNVPITRTTVAGLECRCHDERRPSTRSILACVEALAAQGVGDIRVLGVITAVVARQGVGDVGIAVLSMTCLSAASKATGNVRCRFAARRRIPRQAVALKKNRCGISPVSKMSDNEDTTASLGYSKVSSVQNPVGPPVPELSQRPEEGTKVPS